MRHPTRDELERLAEERGIGLTDEELDLAVDLVSDALATYDRINGMDHHAGMVAEREACGFDARAVGAHDGDPHNAYVRKTTVTGPNDGPLSGDDIAIKDNVPVAGVPMTCGSSVFRDYVPAIDATVVRRLLEAGGSIVAKTNLDEMAASSSGELAAGGPIRNPHDPGYLAGGSSGGSAVAVVTGEADIAIGTDAAGSIRTPASWCGCVGLKPTHGLVPYTGIVRGGHTIDDVGPLSATVEGCARALESIAGEDPLAPEQGEVEVGDYLGGLADAVGGCTVGLVEEGFAAARPIVAETVRDAIEGFGSEVGVVREVSVPVHRDAKAVWSAISVGEKRALYNSEGLGRLVGGYYDTQFSEAFGKARRVYAEEFPTTLKLKLLVGEYVEDEYLGYYYAKAQNLRRDVTRAYDDALSGVDCLALPTTPRPPLEIKEGATVEERLVRNSGLLANTCPFNLTGHPAISVPAGDVDGLPIGLTLVGKRFGEESLLRLARAFEDATERAAV